MITQPVETPVMDRLTSSAVTTPHSNTSQSNASRSAASANAIATTHDRTTSESLAQGSKRFHMPEPESTNDTPSEEAALNDASLNNETANVPAAMAEPAVTEKDLVQVFKLLADETRLKILLSLQREGELHVSALCQRLGQSQPAVSHHLALLRDADIIRPRRDGKHNYYSVRREYFKSVMGGLMENMVEDAV